MPADCPQPGASGSLMRRLIVALCVLAIVIGGCTSQSLDIPGSTSAASVSASGSLSVGAHVDAKEVTAALDAAAAAGPVRFQSLYSLSAKGYFQTMSRTDGVLDLEASRGVGITEDYPGQLLAAKREVALEGDQVFHRDPRGAGEWVERSGGARSFVDLDASGENVMDVIKAALPNVDGWVAIASGANDAAGSVRLTPVDPVAGNVEVVIDATGRLVSVVASTEPSNPNGGVSVRELTFTEFGVRLDLEPIN